MAMREDRYQAYLETIRRKVCSVCLDRRDDGTCGLTQRTCAIEAHLPEILDVVTAVRSHKMDEYVAAVESQICSHCNSGPQCELRREGECALATYLYLVVAAIEEVDMLSRQGT